MHFSLCGRCGIVFLSKTEIIKLGRIQKLASRIICGIGDLSYTVGKLRHFHDIICIVALTCP